MNEYGRFAEVYDLFMEEIPYEEWAGYLTGLLKEYGITEGLVAELGCGTGNMTERLAAAGYDMTGIDISESMLQEALAKRDESGLPILYLNQDMREFELYGTMRAFVSVCDTMNYLTEYQDLVTTLKLVNNYLDPHGVFIFDLKTGHYYRDIVGNRTETADEEEAVYIWENRFDEETKINEYALTIFEETEEEGLYERFDELHEQRAWEVSEIRRAAEEAGMVFEKAYRAFTKNEADGESERIYIILREQGK